MKEIIKKTNELKTAIMDVCLKEKIIAPKVSIIVPVYNTEKYVHKCLLSLIKQDLKEIEIIVVNDGSTDNSGSIISLFAELDSRIKVINQENKKQGAARNKGTNFATGEYIGFVDSDDWVDENYFKNLYTTAKKFNSDIALATNVRIGNGKTKKRLNISETKFVTELQDKLDICHLWKDACPTNKIYKSDLLKNNNILWPEGVYCEDKIFSAQAIYYANGIVSVPDTYYYYFRRPHSTVNASRSKKKYIDRDNARKQVLEFFKSHNALIRDKDFWATKKEYKTFGIVWYKIKESMHTEKHLLFGIIPIKEVKS